MQTLSALQEAVGAWDSLQQELTDTYDLIEMALDEDEVSPAEEAEFVQEVEALTKHLDDMIFRTTMSGRHTGEDAVVSISAGAGGTESQDWVEMLLRMYLRWAEDRRYKTQLLDQLDGEGAGLKSVTFSVQGKYAYGYARAEHGVHRLVRISPFDSSNRRHTSFALVEVIPDIKSEIEIEISPSDIEIDTFRASGAGGQHVQKNDTAIRIKHLPTGIVVSCQNQRSQIQNRETAMRILKARLYTMEMKCFEEEQAKLKGEHVEAGWGNQIRSYVLHPYKMVKDHRTNHEVGHAEAVLDGRLDDFIEAYLLYDIGP